MLADASREYERVDTAKRGSHRRDTRSQAVQVDLQREYGLLVAARQQLAYVAGAGKPQWPRLRLR